jgi:hypothetical protein
VAEGATLKVSCEHVGLKQVHARRWINLDEQGARQAYEQALQMQADSWADRIVEIADCSTLEEAVISKMRIETRKWLMGKNNRRFSDKVTVAGAGPDGEHVIATRQQSSAEIAAQLKARGIPLETVFGADIPKLED